jgi:hypothetical protein
LPPGWEASRGLLRTQRGAETFGEVRVPDGVEVLVARTIKADGRLEEPEERADKETLSMPSLAPGDTIDYAWLRQAPAKAYVRPDVLSDTFFLQSYQAPILRSEWTVATAPDLPLVVEQHGALPQPVTRRLDGPGGGLLARTWARTGADVVRAEPDIPDARETLPYVRVGTIDWPTLVARITDDVLPLRRPGPLGEAVAAQIAAETADPEARTRAAWAAVRELVTDETEAFFETPAAHTFAEGRGERLFALAALLDRLGVPNDLVLAKPVNRADEDGPVPDPLAYSYGLLRVRLGAREVWLDPSLRHMPFDALPPVVQGRPALLASPKAPGAALRTPPGDLERQLRRVTLTLEVLPGGGGLTGEGREELHGIQAVSLRQAFEEATEDERRAAVTTLVRASVPRARLLDLQIDHLDDPERPLVLRYRLAAELTPPTVPGPPQRVPLGLLPEAYSASWAQLPVRHHPLFFNVAIRQSLDLTVVLPDSADLARVPQGQKLATDFGTHETKIWAQRGEDGRERLRVRKELQVPLAVVPPADYARFAGACRSLDRADRLELDVRWRR